MIRSRLMGIANVRAHALPVHQQNNRPPFRPFCPCRQGEKGQKPGRGCPFRKAWPRSSKGLLEGPAPSEALPEGPMPSKALSEGLNIFWKGWVKEAGRSHQRSMETCTKPPHFEYKQL